MVTAVTHGDGVSSNSMSILVKCSRKETVNEQFLALTAMTQWCGALQGVGEGTPSGLPQCQEPRPAGRGGSLHICRQQWVLPQV